ncbi:Nramp family divalent metal transporter [Pseudokineococcus basanitobsidens]|uniref:Nramp family divalent metal transporter n=1 Tax=Pseudokineococcus basanitobsidens TaxID=1926649 RepID=A0ABU8RKX2_9ACTN
MDAAHPDPAPAGAPPGRERPTAADAGPGADAPQRRASLRRVGPGIVVAATGVGAGDLVATLVAGAELGYTLLWAAVVGCVVKIALAEATGRFHLATGTTIIEGWRSLTRWATGYFAVYVVVWGFVYGATAMTASALPLAALFPDVMPLAAWGALCGVAGLVLVLTSRYAVFEKIMTALIGVMFVVVVGLAVLVAPDVPAMLAGLVPRLPDGSVVYTLGLVGGVGGTITMAAYGYWVNAKGWHDRGWMRVMRWDNRTAYITTGVFVVAMLVVGAELLNAASISLTEGDRGLLDLGQVLEDRFGAVVATVFLVGFFAAAFSSLLGVWNGVGLLFADFVAVLRGGAGSPARAQRPERTTAFRLYAVWLTFPPMLLLLLGQPFQLVLAYGVLGAFFMPFLAGTLIWLLNSARTPRQWRNSWLSNALLAAAGLLFLVLSVVQVLSYLT